MKLTMISEGQKGKVRELAISRLFGCLSTSVSLQPLDGMPRCVDDDTTPPNGSDCSVGLVGMACFPNNLLARVSPL